MSSVSTTTAASSGPPTGFAVGKEEHTGRHVMTVRTQNDTDGDIVTQGVYLDQCLFILLITDIPPSPVAEAVNPDVAGDEPALQVAVGRWWIYWMAAAPQVPGANGTAADGKVNGHCASGYLDGEGAKVGGNLHDTTFMDSFHDDIRQALINGAGKGKLMPRNVHRVRSLDAVKTILTEKVKLTPTSATNVVEYLKRN